MVHCSIKYKQDTCIKFHKIGCSAPYPHMVHIHDFTDIVLTLKWLSWLEKHSKTDNCTERERLSFFFWLKKKNTFLYKCDLY